MTPKPTREPLPKANCREKPNHLRVLTHFTAVFLLIGILSGGRSGHLISPAFAQTEIFYRSDRVGDKSFDTYYDARQVMIRQDRYWYDPAAKTWVGQTVDANGAVVQVIREENSRVHNDFGLFLGENIKTTKERFRPGSALPYEVSVSNEYNRAANSTDLNIWDTIIGDTKITTIKTYSQSPPRTLLKTVVEELRAVRLDAKGSPIYAGTRTTTTPDGVTVEILEGSPSQQWKPDPTKLVELPEADVSLLEMRCRAATGKQKALTTEEQDLSDARVKLDLRITELKRDIFSAKAWKPLESYQWDYQRKIDPFTGEINRDYEVGVRNYCGFCGTAEKSIMRRFWGTFGPPDAQGQSTHYNPVPQAVDEVRYLYEERLVRRARGNMIEGLLPPCVREVVRCSTFLYFSGGRDRTLTWDTHRNADLRC